MLSQAEVIDLERELKLRAKEAEELVENFSVQDLVELPRTEVSLDGVRYVIHGTVHTPQLKGLVRDYAKIYHRPEMGEDYVNEERLARLFGLENEMDDITATKIEYDWKNKEWWEILAQYTLRCFAGSVSNQRVVMEYGFIPIYHKLPHSISKKISEDVRYLPVAREFFRLASPPQPLGMEYELATRTGALSAPFYRVAPCPVRSQHMVKYGENRAKERGLHTLHFIVGLGHEPQIEYLLKHPNYVLIQ